MNILKKVGSLAYHTQKLTVSIIKEPVDMASTIITGYKEAKQDEEQKAQEVERILNDTPRSYPVGSAAKDRVRQPVQQELDLS